MAFDKDTIKNKIISYAKDIYLIDAAGGAMHIVLDDFNCSDGNLEFCIEYVWHYDYPDHERMLYSFCIAYLCMLPEVERLKLLTERYDEYSHSKHSIL